MDERALRVACIATATVMAAATILYIAIRPTSTTPDMPTDPRAIAKRLAAHPADWRAASALTEHALDAPVADRLALWRDAHEVALHLAPNREAPRIAFAKSAFFHWSELSPADRAAALTDIAPLLHDESTFMSMVHPLFELTGDLEMLRRNQPGTAASIVQLQNIAAMYGLFADYRQLRADLDRRASAEFFAKVPLFDSGDDVIDALPSPPYRASDQPMLVAALQQLHLRPLEAMKRNDVISGLIDYAVRHHLEPLDGLAVAVRSPGTIDDNDRIRLAEALGEEKQAAAIRMSAPPRPNDAGWQGLRGGDMTVDPRAWIDLDVRHPAVTLTLQETLHDNIAPYVEIYFDDRLVQEGEVVGQRTFTIPSTIGPHRLEAEVINRATRNSTPREVRVVNVVP